MLSFPSMLGNWITFHWGECKRFGILIRSPVDIKSQVFPSDTSPRQMADNLFQHQWTHFRLLSVAGSHLCPKLTNSDFFVRENGENNAESFLSPFSSTGNHFSSHCLSVCCECVVFLQRKSTQAYRMYSNSWLINWKPCEHDYRHVSMRPNHIKYAQSCYNVVA